MAETFDVIVVGLGAMGSATAYHIARRGRRVLGLEQFAPKHTFGSSHGESRIIREIYYEHPLFVPLVRRAYELWRQLEIDAQRELLHIRGGLMIGRSDGRLVTGVLRSAREHRMPHEILTAAEVAARFPTFCPGDENVAIFDPRAGFLRADACVEAHQTLATQSGATLRFGEPVTSWSAGADGVRVDTPSGSYRARWLVLSAGSWMRRLVPRLALPLTVERQVLLWFDLPVRGRDVDPYDPDRFPIYLCEYAPGRSLYGFPRLETGLKAALFHEGDLVSDPDLVNRTVEEEDVRRVREQLHRFVVGTEEARLRASQVCLFTNTPDTHFVIDFHPEHRSVLISSPCSGHGFKFASVIGELQADLLLEGRARFDLTPFRLSRFTLPTVDHP